MTDPIRIANCSGFFGDRLGGALEMVEGGPIDVLTGDWLAELTMLILSRIRAKRPGGGFARTFVTQMEQVMGTCLDRGIRVGHQCRRARPRRLRRGVAEVADKLGLSPTIAYVDGDDLLAGSTDLVERRRAPTLRRRRIAGRPVGVPHRQRLPRLLGDRRRAAAGADIVITGRVTDAAVVCGPAAWHHGWNRTDFDALAGAVVAGHVIECSAQVTGGNYSFFDEIPDGLDDPLRVPVRRGRSRRLVGDQQARRHRRGGHRRHRHLAAALRDRRPRVPRPRRHRPLRHDRSSNRSGPIGCASRASVGEAPPTTLKVAMNEIGGYRNSFTVALTGLDIEAKAAFAEATFWDACPYGPDDFESITSRIIRTDKSDPATRKRRPPPGASRSRITTNARSVGRSPTPWSTPPSPASPACTGSAADRRRPALRRLPAGHGAVRPGPELRASRQRHRRSATVSGAHRRPPSRSRRPRSAPPPTGPPSAHRAAAIVGARSGDKGGNANLGVFARSDRGLGLARQRTHVERAARTPARDGRRWTVDRYRCPNIRSLNFVIRGLLEEGVAASTRQDAQAKALGEWLRSRHVDLPVSLLEAAPAPTSIPVQVHAHEESGHRDVRHRRPDPGVHPLP